MAHFAEIDLNNKVLRVVVACNQDIANNGGEQSEQAAEHFKTICPLSLQGVKWVQTSYNNNFRKKYAAIGDTYDPINNKFILPRPFPSWNLNENDKWQAPVPYPTTYNYTRLNSDGSPIPDSYDWNENNQSWDLRQLTL